MNTPLIFVNYDGINNSVFAGQVLQPLINRREKDYTKKIYLISFEHDAPINFEYTKRKCMHYDIELIICKKKHFLGISSLKAAVKQLIKILAPYSDYELIARGPFAGYITLHAYDSKKCTQLIIQARGLLAEEYVYTHRHATYAAKLIHLLRSKQLYALEKKVYNKPPKNIIIEAVSNALKDYLIKEFNTPATQITIAHNDIPTKIIPAQKIEWRNKIRTQLGIAASAHVYCYNGSAKPWQCPEQVLNFFKTEYEKNKNSFLLILSQDIAEFEQLIAKYNLDKQHYFIKKVLHTEMYEYLSACDTGLIFREENVLNWVSRPTKILEYQAVGLTVEHNNTIALLSNK